MGKYSFYYLKQERIINFECKFKCFTNYAWFKLKYFKKMILPDDNSTPTEKKSWLKKVGVYGFLFFLLKGLVWIGIAIWAWWKVK